MSSVKFHLYVKQHKITGLKYFGFSKKLSPKYLGSGKYWLRHIRKHGVEHVETLQTWVFEDQESCSKFALEFSSKNNIVESRDWANLREENALDGNVPGDILSRRTRELWQDDIYREAHLKGTQTDSNRLYMSNSTKNLWQDPEYVAKQSRAHSEAMNKDEYKNWHSDHKKRLWQDAEYREKILESRKGSITEEYKSAAAARSKARWADPEFKARMKEIHKNKTWWNNGIVEKKSLEPPAPEWNRGRLK